MAAQGNHAVGDVSCLGDLLERHAQGVGEHDEDYPDEDMAQVYPDLGAFVPVEPPSEHGGKPHKDVPDQQRPLLAARALLVLLLAAVLCVMRSVL